VPAEAGAQQAGAQLFLLSKKEKEKKRMEKKSGRRHVPGAAGDQLFLREPAPVPLPGRRVSVGICS
jgi:hypothetical protein